MPSSIYNSLGTTQPLGVKNIFGNRDSASALANLTNSESNKYETLEAMPAEKIKELGEIEKSIATAARNTVNAEDLQAKTAAALAGMQKLIDKLHALGSQITTYSSGIVTVPQVQTMKIQLTSCLQSLSDTLNSTYGNGSYVFGAGSDDTRAPVNETLVTINGNLAPDGSASDSYVAVKSQAKDVTISKNLQICASIDPSNDAFVSTIGGIWAALNAINGAAGGTVPTNLGTAGALFQKGMQSMGGLTSDIKAMNDQAKTAIKENAKESDGAKQKLECFKVDDLTRIAAVKDQARHEEMQMMLATLIMRAEKEIAQLIHEAGR